MALLSQGLTASELRDRALQPADASLVRCEVLRNAIEDQTLLDNAIAGIQRIDDVLLRALVGQLPEQWMTREDKMLLLEFLIARRNALRDIVLAASSDLFPNLH
jgi:hypothetical protein